MNPSQTSSNTTTNNGIIGTPYQDIQQWDGQQTAPDDCAVRAQQFIIEQFTGQKLSEQGLEQEAQSKGWYNPGQGGTPLADVGNLLQAHGIPVDHYDHATVSQLESELSQGHKVILGVNAEDLWSHDPALQGIVQASGSQGADHAIVVSGIDDSDPNNVRVIVSDPGTGEATASYALNDFLTAWKTSNFSMVATQEPDPSYTATHTQSTDTTTPTEPSDPTTTTDPNHLNDPSQTSPDMWMPYNFFAPMENLPGMEHLPGMENLPGAWNATMAQPAGLFMEEPATAFESFQHEMTPEAIAFEQQAVEEYGQYAQSYEFPSPLEY